MAATFAFRSAPAGNPRSKLSPNPHCCPARTSYPIAAQFCPLAIQQPLSSLAFLCRRGALSVVARADKDGASKGGLRVPSDQEYDEAKGRIAMPERLLDLKEVPETIPLRPFVALALAFIIYARTAILWELTNWMNIVIGYIIGPVSFLGSSVRIILCVIMYYIGDTVVALISYPISYIRPIYFSIVAFAPVWELSTIVLLTSSVLAIAAAASPDSVNDQQSLLITAGLVGFGAVRGFLPVILFWLSVVGFFGYSRFIKKRDVVSAALPSVALLTAAGEPWLRTLCFSAYLAFSIFQYSKTFQNDKGNDKVTGERGKPPIPLVLAAMAIGINLAAAWIRQRHLTWMIV